jgi:periplasmic divalent cation tolerance protein
VDADDQGLDGHGAIVRAARRLGKASPGGPRRYTAPSPEAGPMPFVLILTTVGDEPTAQQLSRTLVEEGLCACAQIEHIESVYRWQGQVLQAPEWRILFKAGADRYAQVEQRLRELHPYELPAIYSLRPEQAWPAFAQWVQQP